MKDCESNIILIDKVHPWFPLNKQEHFDITNRLFRLLRLNLTGLTLPTFILLVRSQYLPILVDAIRVNPVDPALKDREMS